MGVAIGDYDRNGTMDIFKTNFAGDTSTLYANTGEGLCEDRTFAGGIGLNTRWLGWGAGFLDLDRDGWLDLFLANGHVYPEVDQLKTDAGYRQRKVVYRNLGNGRFEDVTERLGPPVTTAKAARGTAFGDFDNDGDVDVVVNNVHDTPDLLRLDSDPSAHWLAVRLVGHGVQPQRDRRPRAAGGRRRPRGWTRCAAAAATTRRTTCACTSASARWRRWIASRCAGRTASRSTGPAWRSIGSSPSRKGRAVAGGRGDGVDRAAGGRAAAGRRRPIRPRRRPRRGARAHRRRQAAGRHRRAEGLRSRRRSARRPPARRRPLPRERARPRHRAPDRGRGPPAAGLDREGRGDAGARPVAVPLRPGGGRAPLPRAHAGGGARQHGAGLRAGHGLHPDPAAGQGAAGLGAHLRRRARLRGRAPADRADDDPRPARRPGGARSCGWRCSRTRGSPTPTTCSARRRCSAGSSTRASPSSRRSSRSIPPTRWPSSASATPTSAR